MAKRKATGPALLKRWRQRHGFSQEQAAGRLGVTAAAVCDWESGKKTPNSTNMMRIHSESGGDVPFDAWMSDPEERQRVRSAMSSARTTG